MFYGPPDNNSLQLLKLYFTKYPEDASRVVLSLKGAYNPATHQPECSPAQIRAAVAEARRVLDGCKSIDLFQCARVDPKVPVETSVQALAELIQEGQIGAYGLSEVSAATIRRAHAVHPCGGVEAELSLFSREILEAGGVADTCRELGIPVIGYCPLDRGWLTGQLKTLADLPADDQRHMFPRFRPGAFEQNVKLAEQVEALARRKGCTSAQVAINWVVQQGVLPIPGSTKTERVRENGKVAPLTSAELAELKAAVEKTKIVGDRYPEPFQALLAQ